MSCSRRDDQRHPGVQQPRQAAARPLLPAPGAGRGAARWGAGWGGRGPRPWPLGARRRRRRSSRSSATPSIWCCGATSTSATSWSAAGTAPAGRGGLRAARPLSPASPRSLFGSPDCKLIYRHYATLYFVFCVDSSESELGILDLIQVGAAGSPELRAVGRRPRWQRLSGPGRPAATDRG